MRKQRVIIGLSASLFLSIAAALALGACSHNADDCHNTLTCPYPDYCAEAGADANVNEIDGCFGFGP